MKIPKERPDSWRVIITIIALGYLGFFVYAMISDLSLELANLHHVDYGNVGALGLLVMMGVLLVHDLMKQISLFKSTEENK